MTTAPIRPARPEDHAAIAALQIASWRSVYAGLVPDAYLGAPAAQEIEARWQGFQPGRRDLLLVAGPDVGPIEGFVYVQGDKEPPYVDSLHVSPALKGRGTGRRLLQAAAQALIARGRQGLWLTVVAGNDGALAFYQRVGAEQQSPQQEPFGGASVTTYPMVWADLGMLAASA